MSPVGRSSHSSSSDKENVKPRATAGVVRPSPGELEALLFEERERRRRRRLCQVRAQSSAASKMVRDNVRQKYNDDLKKAAVSEVEASIRAKTVELAALEEEYQQCLSSMGMAAAAAEEHHRHLEWAADLQRKQRAVAEARGARALKDVRHKKMVDSKVRENKVAVRKGVLLAEKLRTKDMLREKDSGGAVWTDLDERPEACFVRRLPSAEVAKHSGLEAAIREQEEEERRQRARDLQQEAARKRGEIALRREVEERRRTVQLPQHQQHQQQQQQQQQQGGVHRQQMMDVQQRLSSSTSSESAQEGMLSTIQEVDEDTSRLTSTLRAMAEDEVDLVPVRGPSSSAEESGGPSRGERPGRGRGESELDSSDLDEIRSLLERVNKQKEDLMRVDGAGAGAKSQAVTAADRQFIARVLGIDPGRLGADANEKVLIRINIEETSTLTSFESSSASLSLSRRSVESEASAFGHPSATSTVVKRRHGEQEEADEVDHDVTAYQTIHSLIEELRSSSSSVSSRSEPERRSRHLRHYIEQLLHMKREEIAALSVTESNASTSVSPSLLSSSYPSSLSKRSDSDTSPDFSK